MVPILLESENIIYNASSHALAQCLVITPLDLASLEVVERYLNTEEDVSDRLILYHRDGQSGLLRMVFLLTARVAVCACLFS